MNKRELKALTGQAQSKIDSFVDSNQIDMHNCYAVQGNAEFHSGRCGDHEILFAYVTTHDYDPVVKYYDEDLHEYRWCYNCNSFHTFESIHFVEIAKEDGNSMFVDLCSECFYTNYVECGHCNKYYKKDLGHEVDGVTVCPSCLESEVATCEDCAHEHLRDNMTNIEYNFDRDTESYNDSKYVCETCLQDTNKYRLCSRCGKYEPIESMHEVDGEMLCSKCFSENYFVCPSCHQIHLISEGHSISRSNGTTQLLCNACYETNHGVVRCTKCGREIPYDEANFDPVGKPYCDRCSDGATIGYHHYNRDNYRPLKLEDETTNLFFGTEDETNGEPVNACYVLREFGDLFHTEHDSSIGRGFEIISQPMSLAYAKSQYDRISEMMKKLVSNGQIADKTSTCGLHVHVSRDAFTDDDAINRAVAMIVEFKRNVEVIARRKDGGYYRYGSLHRDGDTRHIITKEKIERHDNHGHGVAVNLSNEKTVEFRIFRGTLNPNTYFATLEFVNNVVQMANSGLKRFKFKELLKGEYLEAYIQDRIDKGHAMDLEQAIDFGGYDQTKLKAMLKEKRDLVEAIKNFNADPSHQFKINFEALLQQQVRAGNTRPSRSNAEGGNA